jgi:hypothetical protein
LISCAVLLRFRLIPNIKQVFTFPQRSVRHLKTVREDTVLITATWTCTCRVNSIGMSLPVALDRLLVRRRCGGSLVMQRVQFSHLM